jgi:DNA-nicking Smr family endonuclease
MDKGEKWWETIKATITPLSMYRSKRIVRVTDKEQTCIDLHGLTVQDAYRVVVEFINTRSADNILIITGKSGQIRKECPDWLLLNPRVRSWEEQNGGGAFRVKLVTRS